MLQYRMHTHVIRVAYHIARLIYEKKAYVFMVYLKLCYVSIQHSGKQPRTKRKNTHILVTA